MSQHPPVPSVRTLRCANASWARLCALAVFASSLFACTSHRAPRDFVIDAIEGAELAQVQVPESGTRVLFSPTSGRMPITGGERNMGFLTVAAQHVGFNAHCAADRQEGLDLLEGQGVVGVADDDKHIGQVPHRLAASVVDEFETKMQAWQQDPKSSYCRDQVIAAFDAIVDWAESGKPMPDKPSEKRSETEGILVRGLRLRQVVQYHRIDTIVADASHQAMASLLACAHSPTRVFIYAQSAPTESYDGIFAQNIHVMAVSDASARRFAGARHLSVVLNGINLRRFAPAPSPVHQIRDELGIPASAFVIGNTGYIDGLKNQVAILKGAIAAAKYRADTHVIFVGAEVSREYKTQLDALAKAHHFENHVHYLGTRSDVDSILKELDVFVFPSLHEGFGLSLAEAMATEVPTIASDLEAFHEFVGDTVELVDLQDDGTHMKAAIEQVMRHPQTAKARAKRSRQQLIDKGLNTDRMVVDFALMLGARPHLGLEPAPKPLPRNPDTSAPTVGNVTPVTRRF